MGSPTGPAAEVKTQREMKSSEGNTRLQRRSSVAQKEKKVTASPPPPPSNTALQASSNVTSNSGTADKAASQDAEDFFARAKAMGLNLTRQDYERARAGVSAFLRAQRVEKTDHVGGTTSDNKLASSSSNSVSNHDTSSHSTSDRSPAISSMANPGSGKLSSQSKLGAGRSASSPMLSFFTAVIPSEEDEAKIRPSLDDVSALEEKKRRRERRRRLRVKQELLAKEGVPASSHVKTLSHSSSALDTSPLTNVSAENGYVRNSSSMPPPNRFEKVASTSSSSFDALQGHVGLGLQIDGNMKALTDEQEGKEVEALLQSPVRSLQKESMLIESPNLHKLSKKAHIDPEGRLTLMATPGRLGGRLASADTLMSTSQDLLEDDEMLAPINAGGADTDDSGVFFNMEVPSKKEWRRHERDSSDDTSPIVDLHESLNRMGFLDRVMAQKKSPARLKREARAKRKEAERMMGNGDNDLVVMVATTAPSPASATTASNQSSLLPSMPPPSNRQQIDRLDVSHAKNVRWARGTSSPRQRMTTKEHYDFAFYGIAPNAEFGAQYPIFEEEVEHKRMPTESSSVNDAAHLFHVRQRTTSVWMKNASGSPVNSRNSLTGVNDSPGVLSMQFDNMTDHTSNLTGLPARRGLLFGSFSNDWTPTGMEQNDTIHKSPARNVFDAYTAATPPAKLMTRAHTLAAPFSFQQNGINGMDRSPRASIDEGSDKMMLMGAHSSGSLDRRLSNVTRRDDDEEGGGGDLNEGKENLPPGASVEQQQLYQRLRKASVNWNLHSPMSKYDTISPATVFGMSSAGNRIRVLSGDIAEMGRLPLEPSKTQRNKMMTMDEAHSDEEGDDEREMDASPAFNEGGRSSPLKLVSKRHFENRGHARDSSASTSAFEDSPMYLDIGNRTASIVSTVASGSDLARALGMNTGEGQQKGIEGSQQQKGGAMNSKKKRKTLQQQQQQQQQQSQDQGESKAVTSGENHARFVAPMDSTIPINPTLGRMEWGKPDGSRVIKLISEELQAALESGQLAQEPPPRYYKLPPDWGRSKSKPQSVSYAGLIGQSILSSSDGRLSLNEIYNWISTVFPFFERGDRGWQNSIRHNLSLNKSFIKVERDANVPGKGGWWAIKEGHEDRFRGGSYIAPGSALSQKSSNSKGNKMSSSQSESVFNAGDDLSNAWPRSSQDESVEGQSTRRKRQESDQREVGASEKYNESDLHQSQSQQGITSAMNKSGSNSVPTKKSKKVKLIKKSSVGDSLEEVASAHPGNMSIGQERVPLKAVQSSSSPRELSSNYDSITPSRSYNYIASSGHGSASTTSMMGNMPMLTDASSPPSSPNNEEENCMPPPSGGIQGAASSQSARKRKQAVNRALDMMNGNLSTQQQQQQQQQNSMQASVFTSSFGTYNTNYHHNVQASPLAHMRGNHSGMNGGGGSLVNSTRLRAGHGHSLMGAMDSPLRRQSNGHHNGSTTTALDSPSRLLVNSPVSSVRDSDTKSMEQSTGRAADDGNLGKEDAGSVNGDRGVNMTALSMIGSPNKDALLRGSTLFRHHLQPHSLPSQQHHLQQQQQQQQSLQQMQPQSQQGYQHASNSFLSPAGLNLQMAMGGSNSPSQNLSGGAAQFLNYGLGNTPNRYADQNNGNFIYQRWGGMTPSPNKMMRNSTTASSNGNLYYSGTHSGSQMQASSSTNLDDPFDYSGNHFQHELEMTTELSNFNMPSESPIKMAYPQIVRNQFFQQPSMTHAHHSQQSSHQQQQQQHTALMSHGNPEPHQIQYVNGHSYNVNLAAANAFGTPP